VSIRYERKDHVIWTITTDDDGQVSRREKHHHSVAAAKRTSHSLQIVAQKGLGRGVLCLIT